MENNFGVVVVGDRVTICDHFGNDWVLDEAFTMLVLVKKSQMYDYSVPNIHLTEQWLKYKNLMMLTWWNSFRMHVRQKLHAFRLCVRMDCLLCHLFVVDGMILFVMVLWRNGNVQVHLCGDALIEGAILIGRCPLQSISLSTIILTRSLDVNCDWPKLRK